MENLSGNAHGRTPIYTFAHTECCAKKTNLMVMMRVTSCALMNHFGWSTGLFGRLKIWVFKCEKIKSKEIAGVKTEEVKIESLKLIKSEDKHTENSLVQIMR